MAGEHMMEARRDMITPRGPVGQGERLGIPDALERIRSALLRDRDGVLTTTRARLARIARARGIAPGIIEDVIQETLLEAWMHLDRLHSVEGFKPWIDEICRNICRRAVRQHQQEQARQAVMAPSGVLGEGIEEAGVDGSDVLDTLAASERFDPVEELSRQELISVLDRALGALPSSARQVIELCYVVELPRVEIAERLGISTSALDTRLHRARGHLRDILNGPLRGEAEAFGLALNDVPDGEVWQMTRLWCPLCARRLEGFFVQHEDASVGPNLHLRCPNCSARLGRDTVHSMGLVSLAGLHAFRPAWKRVMQGLSDRLLCATTQEWYPCFSCGEPMQFRASATGNDTPSVDGSAPFRIHGKCNACGDCVDTWECPFPSLDELVYWSHPRTRQFVLEHPMWTSSFGTEIEHQGSSALSFHLTDRASSSHLTAVADRNSLRILTLGS